MKKTLNKHFACRYEENIKTILESLLEKIREMSDLGKNERAADERQQRAPEDLKNMDECKNSLSQFEEQFASLNEEIKSRDPVDAAEPIQTIHQTIGNRFR